ncbi:Phosphoenolpyruvate/pyruvate domain-containing protein [Mytilinidion resinicola]|uniref:Phosphoenolpyruvate/pyruvate domain-containing protein n=1 Tax=Mytilinidion resinicola TaxID=574789 RepID=A0A6A6Z5J3_9PEZI|nr:Phosphoenolpyruvate/pyruvate domain-containing protein [Mytilinidion resinicola]KAF2816098.1 Phosphoenolpyruvate/pyruvate domain-containing protein [Mytilinidion resinicola]
MSPTPLNTLAQTLKSLHAPGHPLVLTNTYDALTARIIASSPIAPALATASYAIAASAGLSDDALDLSTNLAGIRAIAAVAKESKKPLTADFQDGYGERLEEGVRELIGAGVVGMNLEDYGREKAALYDIDTACERIRSVLRTASDLGVPDFVVNGRTDALLHGGSIADAVERGNAYLAAGATTVFVWGGRERGGISREEVKQLVEAFGGMLNVSLRLDEADEKGGRNLTRQELAEMGVARISVGPGLQAKAMAAFRREAEKVLEG